MDTSDEGGTSVLREYASICRALHTSQTGGFLQRRGVYWDDSWEAVKIYRAHRERLATDSRLLSSATTKNPHAVEPSSRPYKIPRHSSCNLSVGLWGMPGNSAFDVYCRYLISVSRAATETLVLHPLQGLQLPRPVTSYHTPSPGLDRLVASSSAKSYPLGVPSRPR